MITKRTMENQINNIIRLVREFDAFGSDTLKLYLDIENEMRNAFLEEDV